MRSTREKEKDRRSRRWLRCLGWASLAAVHIGPVIASTRHVLVADERGSAAGCGLLWLSLAFFALKAIDLPALRWRIRRAHVLPLVLGCALVHGDVAASRPEKPLFTELPQVVATCVAIDLIRRLATRLPGAIDRLLDSLRTSLVPFMALACRGLIRRDSAPIPIIAAGMGPRPARAPPARA